MRLFEIFIDDGWTVHKRMVAAKSKRRLPDVCGDNEKILSVEDVTKKCFLKDTASMLRTDLRSKGYGMGEIELIAALVEEHINKR